MPGARLASTRLPGPVRTCVGCRGRAAKSALLRVAAVEVEGRMVLVPDPTARLPGRGASVHRDPACVDVAEKRRAFPRALRLDGPLDVMPVKRALEVPPEVPESRRTIPARPVSPDESRSHP